MMPDTPGGGGAAADLVRSIDRAVRIARCGRLLAVCGGWVAAAAGVVAALAAIDVASGGRIGIAFLPWATKVTVVLVLTAAPVVATCRRRLVREGWPCRLGIALATEQRHPRLGESLSRAVEFLEGGPAAEAQARRTNRVDRSPGSATLAQGLRWLAIDQAAAAARDAGGMTVPGIASDVGWIAAGMAAATAIVISTTLLPGWADAVRRQVATSGRPAAAPMPTQAPRSGSGGADTPLPAEATALVTRLAATAAIERRLAELLAVLFVQAPGVPAESLARGARRELDELAEIQEECLHAVDAARGMLATALASAAQSDAAAALRLRDQLHGAVERLASIDREAADAIPSNISANRLRLAGDAAATLADILASAVAGLGATPGALSWQGGGGGAGPEGSLTTAATLARIAARYDVGQQAATTNEEPMPTRSGSASGTGREDAAASEAGTAGRTPSSMQASGGPVTVGPATPLSAEASPIEQVWSLLPATERAHAARAAVESAPAAYRSAIDAYYRALLQSMPERGSTMPSPSPLR